LLRQVGWSIGIAKLLGLDTCRGKLSLNEEEPDSQFLLIVLAKLDLSGCRSELINLLGHGGRVDEDGGGPG
jgi:hypothetical protein